MTVEDDDHPFTIPFTHQAVTQVKVANRPRMPTIVSETQRSVDIVFDVSDLVQYFQDSRLPTGIQRVQIEVITNWMMSASGITNIRLGCYTNDSSFWKEIPQLFFNHLCRLSLVGGLTDSGDWLDAIRELQEHLKSGQPLTFATGSYLINLGTSWWLQNYFLNVRIAKEHYSIKYVPLVYDCIPIITPEHCARDLTRDFIGWTMGVFDHADHIMVISKATGRDVKKLAKYLGHRIPEPAVIPLDADYRGATEGLRAWRKRSADEDIFLKTGIRPGGYVLFVSTIESRKNHGIALSAWLTLVKRHGLRKAPFLVCVGKNGWLNDAVFARIEASELLRSRVLILSKISDVDLHQLYSCCLFTLYPSWYEGWGLPITESLCYGKVPLVSVTSSHVEAGGQFAEYFDLGSENEFVKKIDRLAFDVGYREERELRIRREFKPKTWGQIAANMASVIIDWARTDAEPRALQRATNRYQAALGRYYSLNKPEYFHLLPELSTGEIFRYGDGWWSPEVWGCWTKNKVARLSFSVEVPTCNSLVLYVGIRGVHGLASTASISIDMVIGRHVSLGPLQDQWVVFRLDEQALARLTKAHDKLRIDILFSSNQFADFGRLTGGSDARIAGLGVIGFMACAEDDTKARMNFIESITLGDMFGLDSRALSENVDPPSVWAHVASEQNDFELAEEGAIFGDLTDLSNPQSNLPDFENVPPGLVIAQDA